MERYKDTVTEIDCLFVVDVTPGVNWSDHANRALRSCKRLEILTDASTFPVNAWIGLSQLHTLGGVSLSDITFAGIAAALPRLHTLDAFTTTMERRLGSLRTYCPGCGRSASLEAGRMPHRPGPPTQRHHHRFNTWL
jgi:hypothetical protein